MVGELDRTCAQLLPDALAALSSTSCHPTWTVDVGGISSCDAEGLRALTGARALAANRGRRLRLVTPAPFLAVLLHLAGLEGLLEEVPDEAAESPSPLARTLANRGTESPRDDVRGGAAGATEARAYCGPAHGQQWTVGHEGPPARVELTVGPASCLYRLLRQRRTGRPARDELGYVSYLPITSGTPIGKPESGARILTVPLSGRRSRS
nr:STAS domain-containing protein [Modestobacter marinus]